MKHVYMLCIKEYTISFWSRMVLVLALVINKIANKLQENATFHPFLMVHNKVENANKLIKYLVGYTSSSLLLAEIFYAALKQST